jgi:hypothetical protein
MGPRAALGPGKLETGTITRGRRVDGLEDLASLLACSLSVVGTRE